MNIVLKIYVRFFEPVWLKIKYGILDLLPGDPLLVNMWTPPRARLGHYNYGDDINLVLAGLLSGKRVIPFMYAPFAAKRENYLCIGSIVTQLSNTQSVIWGSGVISADSVLTGKPRKVCAVRGPLSRAFLLKAGVDCPEIYGDPALLLPRFYKPPVVKKYRVGIIPHYSDRDNLLLKHYRGMEDVCVLDVQNYGHWHDFIDKICACEIILSSSLHGLIIPDAYGVPNCWVELSDKVYGNGFKFRDYFLSVGRKDEKPFFMDKVYSVAELEKLCGEWTAPCFDAEALIAACPFR